MTITRTRNQDVADVLCCRMGQGLGVFGMALEPDDLLDKKDPFEAVTVPKSPSFLQLESLFESS